MKSNLLSAVLSGRNAIEKTLHMDSHKKMLLSAAITLGYHFLYALYHGALGILGKSIWFLAVCAFYSLMAMMRFCVVLCGQNTEKYHSNISKHLKLKILGVLFLLLSLALAWINFISLSQNIAISYSKITMITIASYTFYKLTAMIRKAIRQHKNASPLYGVLRNISYAEVAASILTLQRSMLVSFGHMEKEQIRMMNALTGAAVCLFIFMLGIHTIIRSGRGNTIMAKSKLVETNEKIAEKLTSTFEKMEETVVHGYIKIEDAFVDRYLTKDGETVEEAKSRLKQEKPRTNR